MSVPAPETVGFAIRGPIAPEDLPGLSDRVCTILRESRAAVVICDVHGVQPDAVTVDALCRLQVAARRLDRQVRLRHASADLSRLVWFMGLSDVLPDSD